MLHLKPKNRHGVIGDEVQGEFEMVEQEYGEQMTLRGLRDLLNVLINEGYGAYGATFGYDSNVVATYPSRCIEITEKNICFLE